VIQKQALLLLVVALQLNAFEDSDIDGVADADDLCPNSSFEDIVDEDGCVEGEYYWGEVLLSVGVDYNIDDTTTNDYNFLIDYNYDQWGLSLYTSSQSGDINNSTSKSAGDLYLAIEYTLNQEAFSTKLGIGAKIATGDEAVSTGENDYFGTLKLSYLLNEKIALLSQFDYTLTGDSSDIDYKNSFGYGLGLGYLPIEAWYISLLYQNSTSIYRDTDDYRSISITNSYSFGDKISATLGYTRGLDALSYDHIVSLKLGVNFE